MIEELLEQLLDRLDHRYYGKFRGYVHDVRDPENRGRIRAIVPRLLGPDTPTGWALPASPYAGPDQGFFAVPELGTGVWIEFEGGDLSAPIWTGTWWGAPGPDDVGDPSSTARTVAPDARQVPPPGADGSWTPPRTVPETPRHRRPGQRPPEETASPKVRILKSASGHHIVLDDRAGHERIEIHDSRGNRLILSPAGFDAVISNERSINKGSRSAAVDADDSTEVAGASTERIGGASTRTVGGDLTVEVSGSVVERLGAGYQRTIDKDGVTVMIGGQHTEQVTGGVHRTVFGSLNETALGGYGLTSTTGVNIASGGPVKIAVGTADPGLNAFSVDGLLGNISLNSRLGVMQLGGLTAISPLVLGDGLAIHLGMLATILSTLFVAANPITGPAAGPALATWAAMTPALDLSTYAFVKRFPVG